MHWGMILEMACRSELAYHSVVWKMGWSRDQRLGFPLVSYKLRYNYSTALPHTTSPIDVLVITGVSQHSEGETLSNTTTDTCGDVPLLNSFTFID